MSVDPPSPSSGRWAAADRANASKLAGLMPLPISRNATTDTIAPLSVTAYGNPPSSLPWSDGSG